MASAIAVVMGLCQLLGLAIVVGLRGRLARHRTSPPSAPASDDACSRVAAGGLSSSSWASRLNLVGIVSHVVVSSLAKRWFGRRCRAPSRPSGTRTRGASSSWTTC